MRIGILQAGHVPDELIQETGDYCHLYEKFLSGYGFAFDCYSVVNMQFPADARDSDGWLITGSRHGAYEDLPFIAPLETFIREVFSAKIPLIGICFGHQIIAQALGGTVEKFSGGWSVGATEYQLDGEQVMLNAWHQDQVTSLPEQARVVGTSAFCKYAFLRYADSIFSVQAHPEFDSSFVQGLIETRGQGVVPDVLLQQASEKMSEENSNQYLSERAARFFISRSKAA